MVKPTKTAGHASSSAPGTSSTAAAGGRAASRPPESSPAPRLAQVAAMHDFRNRGVVELLEGLLELAKDGQIHGLAYVAKCDPRDHRAGTAGDYRLYPEEALGAVTVLQHRLVKACIQGQDQ